MTLLGAKVERYGKMFIKKDLLNVYKVRSKGAVISRLVFLAVDQKR